MIDINSNNFKEYIELFHCNGNPDEVIGNKAKEPSWQNIIKMNGNSKYKGTDQSILINTNEYSVDIPSLESEKNDKKDSIQYIIHKEVIQILVHNDLPFSSSKQLPFNISNIINIDKIINNDIDMTGLIFSCYMNNLNNYNNIINKYKESVIKFYRKSYVKYISDTQTSYCKGIFTTNKYNHKIYTYAPKSELIEAIKVYYLPSLINTFKCFFNKLSNYGTWNINTIIPNENEYCIIDYKQLTPSKKYIELRKNSDVYKKYNKNDNEFIYRQETALDLLRGLGATLSKSSTLKIKVPSDSIQLEFESSIDNVYNGTNKLKNAYASKMIPVIKDAIASSKNKQGHIWNFNDFLNNDIIITAEYVPEVVLNGNLFNDVNIPDNIESSDVLLKEEYLFGNLQNKITKGITKKLNNLVVSISDTVNDVKNNIIEDIKKSKEFIRNDNLIKELIKLDKNIYTYKSLKNTLEYLNKKYSNNYYIELVLYEYNKYFNTNEYIQKQNTIVQTTNLSNIIQFEDGKVYCFRYIIIKYYINFFRTITNKSLRVISRNYTNGKFYKPSEHPLLTQYVELPSMKWYSESSKEYCREVMKKVIIKNIFNDLIDISSRNDIKKIYLLNKYKIELSKRLPSNSVFNNYFIEYPIISLLGIFNNNSYITFNNINLINNIETNQKNSIFNFNSELSFNYIKWNKLKHFQINIPLWNESLKVFNMNSQLIHMSFPYTSEDINMISIQVFVDDNVDDNNDNNSIKKSIKDDNNFILLNSFKVYEFKIDTGTFNKININIYIPKSFKNIIKYVKMKNNNFIIIDYHNEGNMNIPNFLLNYAL